MIKEFSIHAKATNNKAKIVFSLLFLASFAVLFASTRIELYSGVVGLAGLVMLVAAIFIFTKFLSSKYYYEIAVDSEGTPLFVVNQQIGKRMTTLCRVALYEITRAQCETAEERKKHTTPSGVKKYVYVPTLFSERTCRIYTGGRHERAEIVIEVSDEIAGLINEYAAEARDLKTEQEDLEEY